LETNLSEALSALSVIFGVAVFHLGASSERISTALSLNVPEKSLKHARKEVSYKIWKSVFLDALPSFLILGAISFIMTPTALNHLSNYDFAIWNFDFMTSLYQLLGMIVLVYWLFSFSNLARLLFKFTEFS
jgi:hypothetical protein